ncbi:VanW family protein [Nocardioides bizhenqiangii]|uniref:VanW family protein n=1 Tax=Nocardioides bizhenqiangii TaxID=3095076 RepID=A0ABZ0ZV36_9ACTN|nr:MULTISPECIES: VanW family protein [unclassified Nocardioides]MDZ5621803.1 VanW family protein [Nocardioides sp. HM23]WQQ27512.1 VanW family protein [Nocardioides sp. HM61]
MTLLEEAAAGKSGKPEKRERLGGKVVALVLVLLVALVAGGYAAAHQVAGDKVPLGTTVSGVDIGGMSRADAIAELQEAFAARGAEPIRVEVAGPSTGSGTRGADVRPDEIGLAIDYAATVDAAGAEDSWSPGRQWDYFTGGDDLDAVVDVDDSLLSARLAELSEGLGVPPKNGRVEFEDGRVSVVDPVPGEAVDTEAAGEALTAAYLDGDDSVELTVTEAEADIDDADVQEALNGFANPAMASAVTLVFGRSEVRLQPSQYSDALAMVPEDGELVPQIDERKITRLVEGATSSGEPVDATVELVDGEPKVIPAKPGVEFEPDDVVAVFTDLLSAPEGERTGKVEATVREADFTTKEARALGIKRKVSGFTTYYPHADYRNTNIGRAAELINGTILEPGETFSLNDTVGERTAENGFTIGYVISNGVLVQDYGGGVSQMATTTFNAMFFAGLEDVEHKPHSFYIDRYPEGREATVAWPDLDLQFRNDTDYGVLIHATVTPSTYSTQGVVTVEMYSTKVWDIESITSERYNYRAPATRHLTTPDCEPFTGYSGFDVDVTRVFREHGEDAVHHTEEFHTAYTAADTVVCGRPPKQD